MRTRSLHCQSFFAAACQWIRCSKKVISTKFLCWMKISLSHSHVRTVVVLGVAKGWSLRLSAASSSVFCVSLFPGEEEEENQRSCSGDWIYVSIYWKDTETAMWFRWCSWLIAFDEQEQENTEEVEGRFSSVPEYSELNAIHPPKKGRKRDNSRVRARLLTRGRFLVPELVEEQIVGRDVSSSQ